MSIWPKTSDTPVTPLDHKTIESRLAETDWETSSEYRFIVYGDQRPLADGKWQDIIEKIATMGTLDDRLLFVLDTGDIVGDGGYSDQFVMLREILSPIRDLPYLVTIGNHELESNRPCPARANTALFLSYLDPAFSVGGMYYRKDIGPARFLFLDTTDLLLGEAGDLEGTFCPVPGSRVEAQMEWLVNELAGDSRGPEATTIVAMHVPFIQSSKKHRTDAIALWNYSYQGRSLPNILLDGGVDLVLVGNTHTYERFLVRREDGRQLHHVNLSGQPRANIHWIRDITRRPKNIAGCEKEWLTKKGWSGLDDLQITQQEVMSKNSRNQFGVFTVEGDGGIIMEMFYMDDDKPTGLDWTAPVRLK